MSLPGARVFFAARPKGSPVLPYDYAVEYVQADTSGVRPELTIPLLCEDAFIGDTDKDANLNVTVEATCSLTGGGRGNFVIFGHRQVSPVYPPKVWSRAAASQPYATIAGAALVAADGVICTSLDDWKVCKTELSNGTYRFYADGEMKQEYTPSSTTIVRMYRYQNSTDNSRPQAGTWCALYAPSVAEGASQWSKVARVKKGRIWRNGVLVFDGTPCVIGDTVGFYDSVSGQCRMISMTDYPAFSAGPRI